MINNSLQIIKNFYHKPEEDALQQQTATHFAILNSLYSATRFERERERKTEEVVHRSGEERTHTSQLAVKRSVLWQNESIGNFKTYTGCKIIHNLTLLST